MPSVDRILKAKNQKLLEPEKKLRVEGCNCPQRQTCPISNQCQTRSLVYKADLKYEVVRQGTQGNQEIQKVYFGNSMNTFKQRYGVHKSSFTHRKYKDSTGLSSFIWKLKDRNLNFNLQFSVVTLAPAYTKESKICFLCLAEKTSILYSDHFSSLNKRSEPRTQIWWHTNTIKIWKFQYLGVLSNIWCYLYLVNGHFEKIWYSLICK